jgi:uncharacterized protein YjbI with pentapeptide repeats
MVKVADTSMSALNQVWRVFVTNLKAVAKRAGLKRAGLRRAGLKRAGLRRAELKRAGLRRADDQRGRGQILSGAMHLVSKVQVETSPSAMKRVNSHNARMLVVEGRSQIMCLRFCKSPFVWFDQRRNEVRYTAVLDSRCQAAVGGYD